MTLVGLDTSLRTRLEQLLPHLRTSKASQRKSLPPKPNHLSLRIPKPSPNPPSLPTRPRASSMSETPKTLPPVSQDASQPKLDVPLQKKGWAAKKQEVDPKDIKLGAKSAFLFVQEGGLLPHWQRRWVVLDDLDYSLQVFLYQDVFLSSITHQRILVQRNPTA